ncbi:MAG: hypothetical protein RIR69_1723, partial [Actinomycetota bacterium]
MSIEKKQPEWFKPWKDVGFIRPESAKKWLISGFKPEDAGPWYNLDEVEVHVASDWVKHGFNSEDFKSWSRRGFKSPRIAASWRKYFPNPDDANRWRIAGLRVDGTFAEMLDRGYAPELVLHGELVPWLVSIDQLSHWLE